MLYCLGNSHANVLTRVPPQETGQLIKTTNIASYSFGPILAYNAGGKYKGTISDFILNHVKKDDWIMFCIGEIDCRIHLPKRSKHNDTTLEEEVRKCVDKYFTLFLHMKEYGYNNLICYAVHLSRRYSNDESHLSGPYETRKDITLLFNKYCYDLCIIHNVRFVDIGYMLMDVNQYPKDYYYARHEYDEEDDLCHLGKHAIPVIKQEIVQAVPELKHILNNIENRVEDIVNIPIDHKGINRDVHSHHYKTLEVLVIVFAVLLFLCALVIVHFIIRTKYFKVSLNKLNI